MTNEKGFKSFLSRYGRVIFDFLYFAYFITAIMCKIFYYQFGSGLNEFPLTTMLNFKMLLASLGIVLGIFGFTLFIFVKQSRFSLFIINLLLSLVILADVLYFRYYTTPINMALLYQVGYVGDVSSSIQSLFRMRDIVLLIDLPIYFVFRYIYKKLKFRDREYRHKIKIRWGVSILAIIMSIPMFHYSYNNSSIMHYQWDRNYAARDLGILYYHYYDMQQFTKEEIAKRQPLTEEEINLVEGYFNEKWANDTVNAYYGVAEGKNLVIIQMEALQTFLYENTIEGQEITPFLNDLIEESFYFPNIYYQVGGGNTSDSEFMANVSLYPASSGAVYFRFPQNKYYSFPNALKDRGYNTYSLHAYKPSFWNRSAVYPNLGLDTFINYNDFTIDKKVGWALGDESFFKQGLELMNTEDPFYGFFVTLSSHHPYDAFYGYDFNVGKYEDTQVGNYIKSANYVDKSIEAFFQDMKAKGLYENTIFAIYGDHAGIFEDQADDLTDFLDIPYNEYEWQKIQKIPLIIHVPGADVNGRIETVGGQVDTMPTIANLMGIDMPYTIGKDLMNTEIEDGYAVLRYSSVMTDQFMYLSSTGEVYDMETGELLDKALYEDEIKKYQQDLIISDIILEKDYFNKRTIE
ncbi:LTA synthase family protein [Vallitalea okinawensis]|uniref:LTA synthase family protein n=1 Tax=Vallitalea okinawensis TaxID=2078660 RepID=UPI000CFD9419|nr:LTA synthase family protein [Vallitalea okinawensis]